MGKRSSFKRSKNDLYRTPPKAVVPLHPFLPDRFRFICPFAGDGRLADYLQRVGGVAEALLDINPARGDVQQGDALKWTPPVRRGRVPDFVIDNPPWSRPLLHAAIARYSAMYPTWFLFDADWAQTDQAEPYLQYCHAIVATGRHKWIPNSKHTGKDNACWYFFDQRIPFGGTRFYGKTPAPKKAA